MAKGKREQLTQWVHTKLHPRAGHAPLEHLELRSCGTDNKYEVISTIPVQAPLDADGIATELMQVATEDAEGMGALMRYAVYPYYKDTREPEGCHRFMVDGRNAMQESGEAVFGEPPTNEGIVAHFMRHHEVMMKVLVGTQATANASLQATIARQEKRLERYDEHAEKIFELRESLLDKQMDRELKKTSAENKERLKQMAWQQLEKHGPKLIQLVQSRINAANRGGGDEPPHQPPMLAPHPGYQPSPPYPPPPGYGASPQYPQPPTPPPYYGAQPPQPPQPPPYPAPPPPFVGGGNGGAEVTVAQSAPAPTADQLAQQVVAARAQLAFEFVDAINDDRSFTDVANFAAIERLMDSFTSTHLIELGKVFTPSQNAAFDLIRTSPGLRRDPANMILAVDALIESVDEAQPVSLASVFNDEQTTLFFGLYAAKEMRKNKGRPPPTAASFPSASFPSIADAEHASAAAAPTSSAARAAPPPRHAQAPAAPPPAPSARNRLPVRPRGRVPDARAGGGRP